MEFEWDVAKETANLAKHGISFVAAAEAQENGMTYTFPSGRHEEERWVAIGAHAELMRPIAIVYAMRRGRYRIISARVARTNEEAEYRRQIAHEHAPEGEAEADPGDEP